MWYPIRAHNIRWAAALSGLLLVLAGCQTTNTGQGSVHLGATGAVTATSAPVAYATSLATAAPTNGWAIYRDHRYSFQMPIPPGWQTGAVSWPQEGPNSCGYYQIGIFPPDVKPLLVAPLAETNQEFIEVSLSLNCSAIDKGVGAGWQAEATPVMMSGVTTIVYDRTEVLGTKDSTAQAIFGGILYDVYVTAPPSTAARDNSVFRAILAGFRYTGK